MQEQQATDLRDRDRILARLQAEEAVDTSDNELTRCLAPCVLGRKLLEVAWRLRDERLLTTLDLHTTPDSPHDMPSNKRVDLTTREVDMMHRLLRSFSDAVTTEERHGCTTRSADRHTALVILQKLALATGEGRPVSDD